MSLFGFEVGLILLGVKFVVCLDLIGWMLGCWRV